MRKGTERKGLQIWQNPNSSTKQKPKEMEFYLKCFSTLPLKSIISILTARYIHSIPPPILSPYLSISFLFYINLSIFLSCPFLENFLWLFLYTFPQNTRKKCVEHVVIIFFICKPDTFMFYFQWLLSTLPTICWTSFYVVVLLMYGCMYVVAFFSISTFFLIYKWINSVAWFRFEWVRHTSLLMWTLGEGEIR